MAVVPPNLKGIQTYIKLATDYDRRDPTVAYFCRMYAVQKGIKIDSKSPDCKKYLFSLLDQLDQKKKELVAGGDESVSNDVVGQAHVETKTINLFIWADTEDRKGVFNKNIPVAFFSANLLFDVLTQFGEQDDECKTMQKYSKWKAAYLYKCLKTGETPIPGPEGSDLEDDLGGLGDTSGSSNIPEPTGNYGHPSNVPSKPPTEQYPPPQDLSAYQQPQNLPGNSRQQDTSTPQQPGVSSPGSHLHASQIDISQVKKHCKFAMSALEYEDVASAVDNITKALNMLTGKKH